MPSLNEARRDASTAVPYAAQGHPKAERWNFWIRAPHWKSEPDLESTSAGLVMLALRQNRTACHSHANDVVRTRECKRRISRPYLSVRRSTGQWAHAPREVSSFVPARTFF